MKKDSEETMSKSIASSRATPTKIGSKRVMSTFNIAMGKNEVEEMSPIQIITTSPRQAKAEIMRSKSSSPLPAKK